MIGQPHTRSLLSTALSKNHINRRRRRRSITKRHHYLSPPLIIVSPIDSTGRSKSGFFDSVTSLLLLSLLLFLILLPDCDSFTIRTSTILSTNHRRYTRRGTNTVLRRTHTPNTFHEIIVNMSHPGTTHHCPMDDIENDDDDTIYAFPSTIVDLTLPEPPRDVPPIYMTATTGTTNTSADASSSSITDSSVQVLYKVPTRFNYVTANTTKVIVRRDVHGNDHSTTTPLPNITHHEPEEEEEDAITTKNRNHNANGIGWFTNHRTIYVENGRIRSSNHQPYILHTNGFECISLRESSWAELPSFTDTTSSTTTTNTTVLDDITNLDFTNRNAVLQHYYPYCQALLQQILLQKYGDRVQVWAFDHNVRRQSEMVSSRPAAAHPTEEETSTPPSLDNNGTTTTSTTVIQKPIGLVHGDYTTISAPRRLVLLSEPPKINDVYYEQFRMLSNNNDSNQPPPRTSLLYPKLVQECLTEDVINDNTDGDDTTPRVTGRRYALINVWKNIDPHHPVMALPLACVDATTVSMQHDVRTLELHYTDRIGENYLACRPPKSPTDDHPSSSSSSSSAVKQRREHQWVYYPQMTHEEVLLIKQWDSAGTDINKKGPSSDDDDDKNQEYISTMALHSAFIDPTTPPNNTIPRQSIEVRCVVIWV